MKLLACPVIILLVHIRQAQIKVDERQLRIGLRRRFQLLHSVVVLSAIDVSLAHQQMKFRRTLSNLNQARRRFLLQHRVFGLVCRMFQHVEIIELVRGASPQWLQRADCIRPAIVEEVTKAQEIASLIGIRRLLYDRLKRTDRPREVVLTEIYKPDVQTDSRNARREFLRLVQHFESLRPLLATHMNYAEIGICSRHSGIDRQYRPELALGFIELARTQRGFSSLKQLLRIARCLRGSGRALRRRGALDTYRIRYTARHPAPPPPPPHPPPPPPPRKTS